MVAQKGELKRQAYALVDALKGRAGELSSVGGRLYTLEDPGPYQVRCIRNALRNDPATSGRVRVARLPGHRGWVKLEMKK